MKKKKNNLEKSRKRHQEDYNYVLDSLRSWDGYSLLEFYVEAKTGETLDIDKLPCWILDAFDELPEILNDFQQNRMNINPNDSSEEPQEMLVPLTQLDFNEMRTYHVSN